MKKKIIIFLLLIFLVSLSIHSFKMYKGGEIIKAQSNETPPALFFADIINGPKSGNTDGAGGLTSSQHGAIVTIWGVNLGSSQGTSKVYFKDSAQNITEAAHVYYWVNADGQSGGGPANLYQYQRMQEIAFSIPASVADGLGKIYVKIGGTNSNELDFTIRSGNIYFVKTVENGGSDSNNGNWSSPWLTLDFVGNRARLRYSDPIVIDAGDTIYACDGVQDTNVFDVGGGVSDPDGTEDRPISVIAYPGAHVLAQGTTAGIRNFNTMSEGWNFSKLIVKSESTGIYGFRYMRTVANEVTNYPGGCATGASGAISGSNYPRNTVEGIKVFGNYVHDWGCDSTSKLEHVFYLSNRGKSKVKASDGNCYVTTQDHVSAADNEPGVGVNWQNYWSYWRAATQYDTAWQIGQTYTRSYIKSYELGWNYLSDNKAVYGLHVYDENQCGDFDGPLKIHDNAVVNQKGAAVDICSANIGSAVDPCFTMDVEVYNNLFINDGIGPQPTVGDPASGTGFAVYAYGSTNHANLKFYNNTIYGYGDNNIAATAAVAIRDDFAGTWEWKNNIIVDTKNIVYQGTGYQTIHYQTVPDSFSNNIWYGGSDGNPTGAPSWEVSPIITDPFFINSSGGDFNL